MKYLILALFFNLNSNQTTIRFADYKDLPKIVDLIDQLGYQTTQEILMKKFFTFQNSRFDKIWVATIEDQVIGVLALIISDSTYKQKLVARVDAIVVDKNFQGHGIGKKLLENAESYAKKIGCQEVVLSSSYKRKEAHKFYKRLGYKIYEAYNFEKKLF